MSGKKVEIAVFLFLSVVTARPARAESVGKVVNEGNRLYRQGRFKESLDEYERALTQSPKAVEPEFNKADSYYRLDDLQQAIDLYKVVAAESRDMRLVEKAKYNLGNSYFNQGQKLFDSDLQKALENMQTAVGWWRQTLDINPENENAAKNIEVARLTIKDIIDRINRQKEQQKQQQQQQKQNQEDLKQLLEQQKALADKTGQEQQKPSPDYNDIAKQQSQLKDRTGQMKQKLQQQADPNNPDDQGRKADEKLEKAVEKQKDASEKLEKADAEDAKKSQDEAAKNIEEALKELSEQKGQQQQQQQKEQQQAQQEPNQPAEPNQPQQQPEQVEAPDATAEEILEKEQRQKEQRQLMQSPGFQKVDKDW
ncbi:MAG: tetratricopeptide repeat protein [Sedimentisphaerales bacterium]|nr:tetratricopeptide repeat protein [Sedimentisphaerales bacterium]